MPERDVDIFSYLRDLALYTPDGAVDPELWRRLRFSAFDWFRIKGVPSFFRASQIRDFGLTPDHLPALIRCKAVERVCRGVYHLLNEGRGQHYMLAVACARSPGSIVCLHSALRIHGIQSQAPASVWLAIPQRSRAPRLPHIPLRIVRFSATGRTFRVTETEIDGVPAYITSPARTVADCFRLAHQAGVEAGATAFRDALSKGLVTVEEVVRIEGALPCRRLRALLAWHAQTRPTPEPSGGSSGAV
jgi:hypothetical protein